MQEVAKRLVGKDIFADIVSSGAVCGILKEVVGNSLVIVKKGATKEIFVNLDYVIKLREYPTNKKGKRKSILIDD